MEEKFTRYGLFKGMIVGLAIESFFIMSIVGLIRIACIVL